MNRSVTLPHSYAGSPAYSTGAASGRICGPINFGAGYTVLALMGWSACSLHGGVGGRVGIARLLLCTVVVVLKVRGVCHFALYSLHSCLTAMLVPMHNLQELFKLLHWHSSDRRIIRYTPTYTDPWCCGLRNSLTTCR